MSIREANLNDVESTLAGIKKAAGYNNDIGIVTRQSENIEHYKIADYPIAIISWSTEEKEGADVGFNVIDTFFPIIIRGAIHAESGIETELNKFLDDIEIALTTDPERNGNADLTAPISITVYQGPHEHTLAFDFEFLIKYSYARGNP